jgi:hypothetical protein
MKLKKALRKLSGYLDARKRDQLKQYESLNKLLKKLKKKRDHLRKRFAESNNPIEQSALQKKLDVLTAQRQKGVQLLQRLQAERRSTK